MERKVSVDFEMISRVLDHHERLLIALQLDAVYQGSASYLVCSERWRKLAELYLQLHKYIRHIDNKPDMELSLLDNIHLKW